MSNRLMLLTSGWGKPNWAWQPFMHRCQENGFDALRLSYPNYGFSAIQDSAEAVKGLVAAVSKEYEHICFIGHSMGGLIGRYLIQRTDVGQYINSYVSISTPHQGSYMAYLAPWSRSAMQMRPNSPFLKDLNSLAWPQIPTLTVKASRDVVVPNCSFLGECVTIPRTTHGSIIFGARTFYEIASWLTFDVFGEGPAYNRGQVSTVDVTR